MYQNFYWQRGYGNLSVNPHDIGIAEQYIANQAKHHKKLTFNEEYLDFLKKYNIDFDERYLWD